jgi:hypothetical protein
MFSRFVGRPGDYQAAPLACGERALLLLMLLVKVKKP